MKEVIEESEIFTKDFVYINKKRMIKLMYAEFFPIKEKIYMSYIKYSINSVNSYYEDLMSIIESRC